MNEKELQYHSDIGSNGNQTWDFMFLNTVLFTHCTTSQPQYWTIYFKITLLDIDYLEKSLGKVFLYFKDPGIINA